MTSTITGQSAETLKYNVVGTRPIRHDGLDKVIGVARYGADVQLSGLLHGKILRSPHAHARILSLDTSKAEAVPGVTAVVTYKDFPIIENQVLDLAETQGNSRMMAEHVMAHQKALYQGHTVAALAATSPHIAEIAVNLISAWRRHTRAPLSGTHPRRSPAARPATAKPPRSPTSVRQPNPTWGTPLAIARRALERPGRCPHT